jgi:hypothetical protein
MEVATKEDRDKLERERLGISGTLYSNLRRDRAGGDGSGDRERQRERHREGHGVGHGEGDREDCWGRYPCFGPLSTARRENASICGMLGQEKGRVKFEKVVKWSSGRAAFYAVSVGERGQGEGET